MCNELLLFCCCCSNELMFHVETFAGGRRRPQSTDLPLVPMARGKPSSPLLTRKAPDGQSYTKSEFFAFFAGYSEWDAAAVGGDLPEAVEAGMAVGTNRLDAEATTELCRCPFNPGHAMPAAALHKHMARCPDRGTSAATATKDSRGDRHSAGTEASVASPRTVAATAAPSEAPRVRVPQANTRTTSTTLAHLSDGTFDALGLHPPLLRAIQEVFHFERMTLVQQLAIPICLGVVDRDVVAKARTGTGKTLGFLLPALHRVLTRTTTTTTATTTSSGAARCPILVLSPTRELATQTAEEAKDLLTFVSPSKKVMTVLGGTSMAKDVASFRQGPPVVLVATPGR